MSNNKLFIIIAGDISEIDKFKIESVKTIFSEFSHEERLNMLSSNADEYFSKNLSRDVNLNELTIPEFFDLIMCTHEQLDIFKDFDYRDIVENFTKYNDILVQDQFKNLMYYLKEQMTSHFELKIYELEEYEITTRFLLLGNGYGDFSNISMRTYILINLLARKQKRQLEFNIPAMSGCIGCMSEFIRRMSDEDLMNWLIFSSFKQKSGWQYDLDLDVYNYFNKLFSNNSWEEDMLDTLQAEIHNIKF